MKLCVYCGKQATHEAQNSGRMQHGAYVKDCACESCLKKIPPRPAPVEWKNLEECA